MSGRSPKCLLASVGVRRFIEYGGIGHSQGRNVSQSVQICRALPITDPKPFLASFFESGIVAFTFCTQGVGSFEAQTISVNGAPVIRRNGLVFGSAPIFLSVVPIFGVTRTDGCLRLPEGTAEFLSEPTMSIRSFPSLLIASPAQLRKWDCRLPISLAFWCFCCSEGSRLLPHKHLSQCCRDRAHHNLCP